MTRFRCLGGDCEATCCAAFAVPADEATHVRLKLLGQHDPVAAELVERAVELTPEGPDHGRLRFDDRRCVMLEPSGLCRIQARFGNAGLFEVCATYPRYHSRVDDEVELFGTLSCPEVARLALLAADAFELSTLPLVTPPRKLRNQFRTEGPYYRPFAQVRAALLSALDAPERSLPEKLFAMLWLSDKLRPVLHDRCQPVSEEALAGALSALSEPQVLAQLSRTFHALPADDGLLRSVTDRVLEDADVPAGVQADAAAREWLAPFLTRYAKNHVWTTPYMLLPSLFAYVSDLVLRVALLRAELERRSVGLTEPGEELERRVVQGVYQFVRQVEHTDLLARARRELDAQGLNTFAHAVCLL